MHCPKCTHRLRVAARFCDSCGAPVTYSYTTAEQEDARGEVETLRDDPLLGQVLGGKYELLARLGEGGMGAVYRAGRVHIGDEVAVKVLLRKFVADVASVERFRREARAAARLRHQNVVAIYDYGEARGDDAPAYIVMELLEGTPLRRLLQREGRLTSHHAVTLMRDICAGVGSAHRRGVFHRDLKPDNVIVLAPNEDRESESVKVVDFGIAKLRDPAGAPTLTETGALVGTPHYMSPEQCRGEPLDARSDVYSLGAMLYEMLAGTPPFTAETVTGVMAKHLFDPPPPLPAKLGVAPGLEEVIVRALAKVPDARPADAITFLRELQEAERRAREEEEARAEEERRRAEAERLRVEAEAARRAEEEAARRREEDERRTREEEERQRLKAAAAAVSEEERRRREPPAREFEGLGQRAEDGQRHQDEEPERETLEVKREAGELRRLTGGGEAQRHEGDAAESATTPPPPGPFGEGRWRYLLIAFSLVAVVSAAALIYRSGGATVSENGAPANNNLDPGPPGPSPTPAENATPPGMVFVPGDSFLMGRNGDDPYERPAHRVEVKPFFIGAYEVTCEDYEKFVRETRRAAPQGWADGVCPAGSPRKPATGVTWDDAQAYCQHAAGRLPTEAEWEFAARGTDGRLYPWEGGWRAAAANADGASKGMVDVGSYQAGKSPFGAFHMVGNAWEWTADSWAAYEGGRLSPEELSRDRRVIRGGSFDTNRKQATTTYRRGYPARDAGEYKKIGFRCVSVPPGSPAPP